MVKNIYVIVPHADDEVLMCGGTIAKHVEHGDHVSVAILQKNRNFRTETQLKDALKAKETLKYHHLDFLNIDNNMFSSNFVYVKNNLEDYLAKCNLPDIIYTVSPFDNHQDHQMLFNVMSVVLRMHGPYPVKKVYCGETISSTDRSFKYFKNFNPNFYNVLNEQHITTKINAMCNYSNEIFDMPHPRSKESLKVFAKMRGIECGSMYAEAFCCIRDINT